MGVDTVADGLCCFYQTQTTGQDPAPTLIMSDSSMTFPSASSVRVEDPHRGMLHSNLVLNVHTDLPSNQTCRTANLESSEGAARSHTLASDW